MLIKKKDFLSGKKSKNKCLQYVINVYMYFNQQFIAVAGKFY